MVCFLSVPRWQDVLFPFQCRVRANIVPAGFSAVVTGNYRIFPPDINLFADLFQRCTSHDAFHQIFFRKCAGFQLHHGFLVQQSVQGRQRREDLCVAQVLYRFSFLVEAFQVDVVFVDTFVERADRNASGGCEQGKADIITAQPRARADGWSYSMVSTGT